MEEQAIGPELTLATDRAGARAIVTVTGELDAYSAPGLEEEISGLLSDKVSDLVLDLSGTRFLDSSGLRAILTAQRRVAELDGGRLALRAPSEPVRRLLEITGLSDHFIVES
ncbi:MAG TPA: STAS domain-containing protein [Acidimicrobiia bacterium]|jgi:anti-anti-sigma factor|nr:STAS domain-containing protein [Acidimicrobiia bacterium]